VGHGSTSWRRLSFYATPSGFGGLGLKTTCDRFAGFGPQNPREDLEVARGIIGELASRRNDFMKGLWPSDICKPI